MPLCVQCGAWCKRHRELRRHQQRDHPEANELPLVTRSPPAKAPRIAPPPRIYRLQVQDPAVVSPPPLGSTQFVELAPLPSPLSPLSMPPTAVDGPSAAVARLLPLRQPSWTHRSLRTVCRPPSRTCRQRLKATVRVSSVPSGRNSTDPATEERRPVAVWHWRTKDSSFTYASSRAGHLTTQVLSLIHI